MEKDNDKQSDATGTLYIVGTPIGNLGDMTVRALETLKNVDIVAAEDTRKTRKLFSHFDIHTPMTSFHEHSNKEKLNTLLEKLQAGDNMAFVTDAGTPGISDPGSWLVYNANMLNIPVIPIPGVSALTAAISISAMRCDTFTFLGFLPPKRKRREDLLLSMASQTFVFFESPYRIQNTLKDLERLLPEHSICLTRELTKLYEEVKRGDAASVLLALQSRTSKGEFTVVVAPPAKKKRSKAQQCHVRNSE